MQFELKIYTVIEAETEEEAIEKYRKITQLFDEAYCKGTLDEVSPE